MGADGPTTWDDYHSFFFWGLALVMFFISTTIMLPVCGSCSPPGTSYVDVPFIGRVMEYTDPIEMAGYSACMFNDVQCQFNYQVVSAQINFLYWGAILSVIYGFYKWFN